MIGDLSKRLGGQIAGHRSHRTGRDVDLLFYAETPGGESVTSPGFVKFGPDGLALFPSDRGGTRFIRLDVAREWDEPEERPIGDNKFKFWELRFQEWQGTTRKFHGPGAEQSTSIAVDAKAWAAKVKSMP